MTYVRRKYPLDSLQSDLELLHEELDRSNEAEREANKTAAHLHAENGILAEQLDRTIAERNYWQSYALSMETRLDVIGNVVSEIQANARARALEDAKRIANGAEPSEYAPDPSVRAILRASPRADENDGAGESSPDWLSIIQKPISRCQNGH